jgi:hypothetical protein
VPAFPPREAAVVVLCVIEQVLLHCVRCRGELRQELVQ